MAVLLDLPASVGTWHLQPWVWFWPSFSHSRLDTPGPMADLALGDQREQQLAILRGRKSSCDPLGPQLNRVLEAQATRVHAGIGGGLGHQEADHVVGQQMGLQLLFIHFWRLAAQDVHPCGGLEIAQVEFDVPAARVQL